VLAHGGKSVGKLGRLVITESLPRHYSLTASAQQLALIARAVANFAYCSSELSDSAVARNQAVTAGPHLPTSKIPNS
jgi:hypothetical protein